VTDLYPWVKAAHVVAIIAWMAALLYLPRLMVYHAETTPGDARSETFKVMERRLLRAIATPAMLAAWGLGLWLAHLIGAWSEGWFHLKATLVVALSATHMLYARWVRRFREDERFTPARTFRIWNEIPTLLMIGIVIAVIVKPF